MTPACSAPCAGGRSGPSAPAASPPWRAIAGNAAVSDSVPVSSIGAVAVAASNPNIVYFGTGDVSMVGGSVNMGNGVYRSADAGKTWQHAGLDETEHIGNLWVDPRNPNTVLVAALGRTYSKNQQRGVFKTTDGGKTWRNVLYKDDITGAVDLVFAPGDAKIGYAAMWEHYTAPGGRAAIESAGFAAHLFALPMAACWRRSARGSQSMRTLPVCALVCLLLPAACPAQTRPAQTRWKLDDGGGILWEVQRGDAHQDQIEMSGRKVSAIVTYGVRENGALTLTRQVVFPALRTLPNDTHASLSYTFADDASPRLFLDGRPARETITRFRHRGMIAIESTLGSRGQVALTRTIFPSVDKPLLLEKYLFTNCGTTDAALEVENTGHTVRTIKPGQSTTFALVFAAREVQSTPIPIDVDAEERARRERVDGFLRTSG